MMQAFLTMKHKILVLLPWFINWLQNNIYANVYVNYSILDIRHGEPPGTCYPYFNHYNSSISLKKDTVFHGQLLLLLLGWRVEVRATTLFY